MCELHEIEMWPKVMARRAISVENCTWDQVEQK